MIKKIIFGLALCFAAFIAKAQSQVPYTELNNGQKMPRFGIGTFNVPNDSIMEDAISFALRQGYRHIDTAHAYRIERGVGKGIKQSGVPREEIWLTSKIWPTEYGEGKTAIAIDEMLERLGVDYIDLLYVHQPIGDWRGAWRDMEKAVEAGKVRALGISNFDAADSLYNAVIEFARIKPAVFQIECHPYAQRLEWRKRAAANNIQVECWFPLGGAMSKGALFKDPVIMRIAEAHGKTPAQIILRWHIQEGLSAIPGATNHDYITENISIFDFELTTEEMEAMRSLNKEQRFFNMSLEDKQKYLLNMKIEY
ncbi:MAG: aldo/keto reductase [Bacteroides sp.]|nr:aldo/keto reductase [Roseburia sp.]MCM1345671.1 aldo/keto reductase [Bacteroides sp.]MCM1419906.1 aldo/keto reductase [Bacteroides sp.]